MIPKLTSSILPTVVYCKRVPSQRDDTKGEKGALVCGHCFGRGSPSAIIIIEILGVLPPSPHGNPETPKVNMMILVYYVYYVCTYSK